MKKKLKKFLPPFLSCLVIYGFMFVGLHNNTTKLNLRKAGAADVTVFDANGKTSSDVIAFTPTVWAAAQAACPQTPILAGALYVVTRTLFSPEPEQNQLQNKIARADYEAMKLSTLD